MQYLNPLGAGLIYVWDLGCWFLKRCSLTHLPPDKKAAISQTILSDAFSWMKIFFIWIKISLKFVPYGPIDNKLAWFR